MSEMAIHQSGVWKIILVFFASTNVKLYKTCYFLQKLCLVLSHQNKTMKSISTQIHHHHSCNQAS